MKAQEFIKDIYYVGVQDKSIRTFDIIMHTDYGTSYNSFLVKTPEKTVLFETVKEKFFDEYIEKLKEVCDISKIDYIVISHTEPDHSSSLERLLELAPNAVVLASNAAIMFLEHILNKPFKSKAVSEGEVIDIGGKTLSFYMVPMLHWPDTIFTYIKEDKALFTCDSFGCHYADERVFSDLIEGDFLDAYKYYFDNIIGPYKTPFMTNALEKIKNLEIDIIGNGHGPVIRGNAKYYIDLYTQWCKPVQNQIKNVVIAYVSAYGYTKLLAEKIKEGILSEKDVNIDMFDLVIDDKKIAQEKIAQSDGFLLGSPTLVGDALPPVYEMLIPLNPTIHKGKIAGAFGSYGWSGEAVPNLLERMKTLKLNIPLEGLKIRLKPSKEQQESAKEFGIAFAKQL